MKVYLYDHLERIDEERLDQWLPLLPEWRREVAMRYRHLAGRRESAMAYLLLQDSLRRDWGIDSVPPFSFQENGKPFLAEYPDVHFSLSHCRTAVLCVVHDKPVGADVEYIRKARPELVRYTMNADEEREIFSSPDPDFAFTRLWTRKEAVVKLTGEGVGSNMHDLLLTSRLKREGILLSTLPGPDYVYSFAHYDDSSSINR